MKKLFLLISLIDTSSLSKQVYADVKESLSGLAKALKVGVEHVYEVIVKQQIVKAISDLVLVLFLLLVSIILFNLTKSTYKSHIAEVGKNGYLDDNAKGPVSLALGIACAIGFISCLVVFCNTYTEIVSGFVNPEYGALQDIMNFVSTLKH